MKDTDAEIVQSILDGGKQAFEMLLERYDRKIYGFVYNIVGDRYMAEDIAQDAFLKAYQNLRSFDMTKNFTTWLFTIARNTAFNYLKKYKRVELLAVDDDCDPYKGYGSNAPGPEDIYEEREFKRDISTLIDSLPEKYKVLIYLKYVEKLSCHEICERLGIPMHKVESRLYMARQKLVKEYNKKHRERSGD